MSIPKSIPIVQEFPGVYGDDRLRPLTPAEVLNQPQVLDSLASIEHDRWAHWQRYMHDKCTRQPDGSLLIPADLVERWERQIETPYADLSTAEQRSDIEQVERYLPTVIASLATH